MTDPTADPSTGAGQDDAGSDLALGLTPGYRFRCEGCGNVTRFDVVAVARTRRFHHFDLGGDDQIAEEDILANDVESVTCRWCGRTDTVGVEQAPTARHS